MENTQKQNCEGLGQGQKSLGECLASDILIGNTAALGSRLGSVGVRRAGDLGCCDSLCPLTEGSGATSASAGGLSSFPELRMGEEEVETTRGAAGTTLGPLVPPRSGQNRRGDSCSSLFLLRSVPRGMDNTGN